MAELQAIEWRNDEARRTYQRRLAVVAVPLAFTLLVAVWVLWQENSVSSATDASNTSSVVVSEGQAASTFEPPAAPTVPPQQNAYAITSAYVAATLRDYEELMINVPVSDPRAAPAGGATLETVQVWVRSPYWINTSAGASRQARAVAAAPAALQEVFRKLPAAVRQGKGTPDELRAAVQAGVATGYIRGPQGAWPPGSADIERWMREFGLGQDCSGFVYEALSRADRALASRGAGGFSNPLGGPATYVGSATLARGGEPVARPDDLRPGDVMYRPPSASNPIGHIRIIDEVRAGDGGIAFHTAESTASLDGPAARWWRFPDPSRFASLEEQSDGTWHVAPAEEQANEYSRRLLPGTRD